MSLAHYNPFFDLPPLVSPHIYDTVMPFILRGVSLLGINSVEMPLSVRTKAWKRLATDLKPSKLALIAPTTIHFSKLANAFVAYVDGTVTGRTVVEIDGSL